MFCPSCGSDAQKADFCPYCQTNLAIIEKFLSREDATGRRNKLISRTGLVCLVVSEGFAWTTISLSLFVLIITLATIFLPLGADLTGSTYITSIVLLILMVICGIPLLLGLVLVFKDLTEVGAKQIKAEKKND